VQHDAEMPREGLQAALTALYDVHYARLVRAAVLLVHDPETAEDVVQDAFVDMCRRWSRLRDREQAAAYLRTAVVNRSRSVLRHRGVVARHRERVAAGAAGPAADDLPTTSARRDRVLDALAALPRRQREVLVLRHYLDLSEAQVAEQLGISRGAVKTHASRGAAALRRTLQEER
jgi:RNA polymerase sigma-70 factor (sigma-E family)